MLPVGQAFIAHCVPFPSFERFGLVTALNSYSNEETLPSRGLPRFFNSPLGSIWHDGGPLPVEGMFFFRDESD